MTRECRISSKELINTVDPFRAKEKLRKKLREAGFDFSKEIILEVDIQTNDYIYRQEEEEA